MTLLKLLLYIDPQSGSLFFQLLLSFFFSVVIFFKRIKIFLFSIFGKQKKNKKDE
jgi:hypothetical protein